MDEESSSGGIAAGLLMAIVGSWVVARTFIHDSHGENLVDRLVALAGGGNRYTPASANATALNDEIRRAQKVGTFPYLLSTLGIGKGVDTAGNPNAGQGDVPTAASMQAPPRFLQTGRRNPLFVTYLAQHNWINPRTGQRDPWAPKPGH